ncbi:hypothetical protein ABTQ33_11525 [Paucilactobacillus suebicus]|nr:hypothetical protein [Paucilactobacillus suebicus]
MTKRKFTTTLDSELIKELKICAVENETSVATLIEEMAKEYLAKATVK